MSDIEYYGIRDKTLSSRLGYKINYDVVRRVINRKNDVLVMYYLSSLTNGAQINATMESLVILENDEMFAGSVEYEDDINKVENQVNGGVCVLLYPNNPKYVLVEMRNFPSRGVSEPESEKSIKGSHDGFTEHIMTNTALIRRRIKTRDFRCENLFIGDLSKTSVVLFYLSHRVNQRLYKQVKEKILSLSIDSLVMADRALAEILFKQKINIFPTVRFTERPDVAAIHIQKGFLVIMVDNSPGAMIIPTTFFELNQQPTEYHLPYIISSFGRLSRMLAFFVALLLVPLWMLNALDP